MRCICITIVGYFITGTLSWLGKIIGKKMSLHASVCMSKIIGMPIKLAVYTYVKYSHC